MKTKYTINCNYWRRALVDNSYINEVKETNFWRGVIVHAIAFSRVIHQWKISKGIGVFINTRSKLIVVYLTFLALYNSFIIPCLSYCIHVWAIACYTHLVHLMSLEEI